MKRVLAILILASLSSGCTALISIGGGPVVVGRPNPSPSPSPEAK